MNEETLFLAAMERSGAERQAFLERACGDDVVLRHRVEALLASHEGNEPFLRRPVLQQMFDPVDVDSAADSALQIGTTSSGESSATQSFPDAIRSALQPSLVPGSLGRLDHYEILEVVGYGGFGIVLKATDDKLHRTVAIKVLSAEQANTQNGRRRFLREARAAAAIQHENVVTLFAVDEQPIPHLVMEFVGGLTLEQRIRQSGAFVVVDIFQIGIQLAKGLAAAHAQGLIHRDIKPSNILIDDGTGRVKITDFGLARAVDDTSLTQASLIAGTPLYMSPEQAEGKRIDERSDLFSLGSVLYTLCTRQAPFRAESTLAVLRHVCEIEPFPVSRLNAAIPPFLESVIQRLHAKAPENRIQTATEVADLLTTALAELQTEGVISARIPSHPAAKAANPLGHFRWIRSRAVTLSVMGAICVSVFIFFAARHRNDAAPADPSDDSESRSHEMDSSELAARMNAADRLNPADIPPGMLALAGSGDPRQVPSELVAILGETHFPHALGLNRNSGILDVALSPDDKYLATAACNFSYESDSMISWEFKLWDFESRRLIRSFDQLSSCVRAVTFNPQSTQIAIADEDGTVKVLRISDGAMLWEIQGHTGRARSVSWNSSGTQIVSGGDHSVAIWDAASGERRVTLDGHSAPVLDVEFSSDDSKIVSTDGLSIMIWSVETQEVLVRLQGGSGTMRSVTFSRDSREVIGVSENSTGYIWDAQTGEILRELKGHEAGIVAVAKNQNNDRIATASIDGTARIWSLTDGSELHKCPGHVKHAACVAMDSAGKFLVTGDTLGRIAVWNAESGEPISDQHRGPVTSVAFGAAGDRLASAGVDGTVRLWDLASGHPERKMHGRFGAANSVAFCPDEHLVAAAGFKVIRVWNALTGKEMRTLEGHSDEVQQIAFGPDGRTLVSVGSDGTLNIWDAEDGKLRYSCPSDGPGYCLTLSPDGEFAAAGSGSEIHLWQISTGRLAGVITGHTQPLRSLAFHPDGRSLLSSADPDDSSVRIWDMNTRRETQRLDGRIGGAAVCLWRGDGRMVATCGMSDGTIQLWDLAEMRFRHRVIPMFHSTINAVRSLAISPEGRYLATANTDGTICLLKLSAQGEVFRVVN